MRFSLILGRWNETEMIFIGSTFVTLETDEDT